MFGFNAISYMSHVSYKCLFLIHVNIVSLHKSFIINSTSQHRTETNIYMTEVYL